MTPRLSRYFLKLSALVSPGLLPTVSQSSPGTRMYVSSGTTSISESWPSAPPFKCRVDGASNSNVLLIAVRRPRDSTVASKVPWNDRTSLVNAPEEIESVSAAVRPEPPHAVTASVTSARPIATRRRLHCFISFGRRESRAESVGAGSEQGPSASRGHSAERSRRFRRGRLHTASQRSTFLAGFRHKGCS